MIGLLSAVCVNGYANLAENAGFEAEGSEAKTALAWDDNQKGGLWGSAMRTDWQQKTGKYSAAIQGAYSGADYGGWWQDCPVEGGAQYELSSFLFWDNDWSADNLELRIEWYSDGQKIDENKKRLSNLPEAKWIQKSITASAPPEADSAHIVLDASGLDTEGVLYMDDISFKQK